MKSEILMRAPARGTIAKINVAPGDLVPEGKELVEFEAEAEPEVPLSEEAKA